MLTKSYIIGKMILDRNFNIPEWVYDEVDNDCLEYIISNLESMDDESVLDKYLNNSDMRMFFDLIKYSHKSTEELITTLESNTKDKVWEYYLILFNKSDFKLYNKMFCTLHFGLMYSVASKYDEFIEPAKRILKENLSSLEFKEFRLAWIRTLSDYHDRGIPHTEIDRLLEIFDISKEYELCEEVLNKGIPVFYKYGDITDIMKYLEVILESEWKGKIEFDIEALNIHEMDMYDSEAISDLLINIIKKVNPVALKYLKYFVDNDTYAYIRSSIFDYGKGTSIKDFRDLIAIFGKNDYGLPIELQREFIYHGGDVKTMVGDNGLYKEATILRTQLICESVITYIPIEDLRYLLYNSSDFVKTLINSSNLSQGNMIKILKALYSYPIDEELWDIINCKSDNYASDYRYILINRIYRYININVAYHYAPVTMMYTEPSVFYITRFIDRDILKYIPAVKLVPYIRKIISREDYVPFNLYSNGEYLSLHKVFDGDYTELINSIVGNQKFGYICDIKDIDHLALINSIIENS